LAAGNLFVGEFDEVAARPVRLLGDICRFLGVRAEPRYLGRTVDRPVNPTAPEPIPERYRAMLTDLLAGELEQLERRFQMSWER
jgi:hypothetical protein